LRNRQLAKLLQHGRESRQLFLTDISVGRVIESQKVQVADKKRIIGYRLAKSKISGRHVPAKRISASFKGTTFSERVRTRSSMRIQHEASRLWREYPNAEEFLLRVRKLERFSRLLGKAQGLFKGVFRVPTKLRQIVNSKLRR
jgi:hypothetical protein